MSRTKAFTLIELLIVVAIIAILAAIAVPNFLEAQVRSKVSRSKADMRSLAVAVESYTVDNNVPPSDCGNGAGGIWRPYAKPARTQAAPSANFTIGFELTTPIAYLSSAAALRDVFKVQKTIVGAQQGREYYCFASWRYREKIQAISYAGSINRDGYWIAMGAGPDTYVNNKPGLNFDFSQSSWIPRGVNYDPTNGTVSNGDIYRSQKLGDKGAERVGPEP